MLTPFQRRKLTRYFNIFDADGNGSFEKTDLDLVVSRLAAIRAIPKGTEGYEAIEAGINLIWDFCREFGVSKNAHSVSLEDWLAHEDYILAREEYRENYMRKITRDVFDLVDEDNNGLINMYDYKKIMSAYGVPEGLPEWSFIHLDSNGDGVISKEEFVTLVEQFNLSDDRDAPGNYLFGPF